MTLRITVGIDPGLTGALATLLDGEPGPMLDMPTTRTDGRHEVNARALAEWLRDLRRAHPGAYLMACLEEVDAAPVGGRRQGTSSMFRFGEGFGQVKGVLASLGVPTARVRPQVWKRHYRLPGKLEVPDAGRQLAIARFPAAADRLTRKKDSGRADALLLALWANTTDAQGRVAA